MNYLFLNTTASAPKTVWTVYRSLDGAQSAISIHHAAVYSEPNLSELSLFPATAASELEAPREIPRLQTPVMSDHRSSIDP